MLTISILSYNKLEYTKRCLNSIFNCLTASKEQYRIVVSDNGSTDGTVEYLQSLENIWFINNKENLGYSKAQNQIMRVFSEDDIILLNNDVEMPDFWLGNLKNYLDDNELGAVSPAIIVNNGKDLDIGAVLDSNARGKSIQCPIDGSNDTEPTWITGSCFFVTRDTINAIGYLDEQFFYYDDVDYCVRMKNAGIKFGCNKDVKIIHFNSVSSDPNKKRQLIEESRQKFIKKWNWK